MPLYFFVNPKLPQPNPQDIRSPNSFLTFTPHSRTQPLSLAPRTCFLQACPSSQNGPLHHRPQSFPSYQDVRLFPFPSRIPLWDHCHHTFPLHRACPPHILPHCHPLWRRASPQSKHLTSCGSGVASMVRGGSGTMSMVLLRWFLTVVQTAVAFLCSRHHSSVDSNQDSRR